MPPRPDHVTSADIVQGMYLWAKSRRTQPHHATILFSGPCASRRRVTPRRLADDLASVWICGASRPTSACAPMRSKPTAGTGCIRVEPARAPLVTHLLDGRRTGRRGIRLSQAGARPDLPVGARIVRLARHRRLRPERHPRSTAPLLRGRRRPHRRLRSFRRWRGRVSSAAQ